MLAGVVRSPTRLAPTDHLAEAQARAKVVLAAMADMGVITKEQALASGRDIRLREGRPELPIGSYFADWISPQAKEAFDRGYGEVKVRTTLDSDLQAQAEKALAQVLAASGDRLHATQGALVAMRTDGRVVAMVGGRDYHQSQFNRVTQAQRQPGSSFKPFVYLAALRRGSTPDSLVLDAPIKIGNRTPENHEFELQQRADHPSPGLRQVEQRRRRSARAGDRRGRDPAGRPGSGRHRAAPQRHDDGAGQRQPAPDPDDLGLRRHRRRRRARQSLRPDRPADSGAEQDAGPVRAAGPAATDAGGGHRGHRSGGRHRRPGLRQDRHQPGLPRRLFHRLRRRPGDRGLGRQRRQLIDAQGGRRHAAGADLATGDELRRGPRQGAGRPVARRADAGPRRSPRRLARRSPTPKPRRSPTRPMFRTPRPLAGQASPPSRRLRRCASSGRVRNP